MQTKKLYVVPTGDDLFVDSARQHNAVNEPESKKGPGPKDKASHKKSPPRR